MIIHNLSTLFSVDILKKVLNIHEMKVPYHDIGIVERFLSHYPYRLI